MKRKILLMALAGVIAIGAVGCGKNNSEFGYAASNINGENHSYSNIKIVSYDGEDDKIVIPDEYNNKPIVAIDAQTFSHAKVNNVKLGNNIQVIGEFAFSFNSNLTSITLNEGLKEIREMAFLQTGLKGNLVIPDSVGAIGKEAFRETKIESVEIGKRTMYFYEGAFTYNNNLKKVIFNNMYAEFKDDTVFDDCPNLTIVAPKGSTAEKYAKDNNIKFEVKED